MEKPMSIAVLGGGESGLGAAILAKQKGHKVFLSDSGIIKEKYHRQLSQAEIDFEESQHSEDRILRCDLIIKSPGIPETSELVIAIRKAGISLISEIEFASRYCEGKIIAITGTNGKTTTTKLCYHLLKNAGFKAAIVGNIGESFAAAVTENNCDYYVVEVSSFQLDDIIDFKPHIAILTNITEDHLDRYKYQVDLYAAAKLKIFQNQDEKDHFIYNIDDPLSTQYLKNAEIKAQKYALSLDETVDQGAYLDENKIFKIILNSKEDMDINELALQGKHNSYNSLAAGVAGRLLNIRKETIRESMANFDSIEHRLEPVLQIYGINFINDSKATNVNSTWYALETMKEPTIWIAGGVDKGNDYAQLLPLVKQHVRAIICLGEDNSKLHAEFDGEVEMVVDAADMDEAVRMSYKIGAKGNNVLLSPACASFDLFENYEDRGRQFKDAVRKL
jgi:UDP-N-acetylmuramoylalanine--D-glutamate ligase